MNGRSRFARLSAIRSWATTTISSTNSAVGFRSVRAGHAVRQDNLTCRVFCFADASRAKRFCENSAASASIRRIAVAAGRGSSGARVKPG